jgi:hypothetical protein
MDGRFIKYKKAENITGPLYIISKSEVVSILYRNGEVENFATIPAAIQPAEQAIQEWSQESRETPAQQSSSVGPAVEPANPPRNNFD